MIDAHAHLGQYPDPEAVLQHLPAGMVLLAVTSTPSEFRALRLRLGRRRQVRLALGLHPALAEQLTPTHLRLFDIELGHTSFVGEVGLDFSIQRSSWSAQERAFSYALARTARNILSLHARRAEARVLELLREHAVARAIFHWYSGPLRVLDRLIESGYYCSINPSMVRSTKGRRIVGRIPPARALVETDGPYLRIAGRPAVPQDVGLVYTALAAEWSCTQSEVTAQVWRNFSTLCRLSATAPRDSMRPGLGRSGPTSVVADLRRKGGGTG